MKKISFSQYEATHIYEWLRFYWAEEYKDDPRFWNKETIKKMGKFGGCYECKKLGERLEKFIGEKEVKEVEKLLKGREQGSFSSPKRKI